MSTSKTSAKELSSAFSGLMGDNTTAISVNKDEYEALLETVNYTTNELQKANQLVWKNPIDIVILPRFQALWEIDENVLASITESMRLSGFDRTHPVLLGTWVNENGKKITALVDGHTRIKAAIVLTLEEIAGMLKQFKSEDEAYEYADKLQWDRRNLTEEQKLKRLINKMADETIKEISQEGRPIATTGRPRKQMNKDDVAKYLRTSPRTATKYISLIDSENKSFLEQVLSNELSINGAYNLLNEKEKGLLGNVAQKSQTPKLAEPTAEFPNTETTDSNYNDASDTVDAKTDEVNIDSDGIKDDSLYGESSTIDAEDSEEPFSEMDNDDSESFDSENSEPVIPTNNPPTTTGLRSWTPQATPKTNAPPVIEFHPSIQGTDRVKTISKVATKECLENLAKALGKKCDTFVDNDQLVEELSLVIKVLEQLLSDMEELL